MATISKCSCPNCGVHVEFDAGDLVPGEVRKGPCPSCEGDMWFFDNSQPESFLVRTRRKMRAVISVFSTQRGGTTNQCPFQWIAKYGWRLLWLVPTLPIIIWLVYRESLQFYAKREQQEVAATQAGSEQNQPAPPPESPSMDFHVFDDDKNFPHVEIATEIIESGWKASTITTKYRIRYINQQCLEIRRKVDVEPSKDILRKWSALHHGFLDNSGDTAQDASGNSNKSDVERELAAWDSYEHDKKRRSTTFQILRKDADEIQKWISKYQQWTQTSLSEHLADGITNSLPTCVYYQDRLEAEPLWNTIEFVTPSVMRIGCDEWDQTEMARLEQLMTTLPDLDEKLKQTIADRDAEQAKAARDLQQELQSHQTEIDRAKAALR